MTQLLPTHYWTDTHKHKQYIPTDINN